MNFRTIHQQWTTSIPAATRRPPPPPRRLLQPPSSLPILPVQRHPPTRLPWGSRIAGSTSQVIDRGEAWRQNRGRRACLLAGSWSSPIVVQNLDRGSRLTGTGWGFFGWCPDSSSAAFLPWETSQALSDLAGAFGVCMYSCTQRLWGCLMITY